MDQVTRTASNCSRSTYFRILVSSLFARGFHRTVTCRLVLIARSRGWYLPARLSVSRQDFPISSTRSLRCLITSPIYYLPAGRTLSTLRSYRRLLKTCGESCTALIFEPGCRIYSARCHHHRNYHRRGETALVQKYIQAEKKSGMLNLHQYHRRYHHQ